MDDFVLLASSKEEAKRIFSAIQHFLCWELKLKLNPKSCYFPSKRGIDFCGYRVFETHRLIRKRSVVKIKKKIKVWNSLSELEDFDIHQVLICWNSFLGHSSHADSYCLQRKLFSTFTFLSDHPNYSFRPYRLSYDKNNIT